MELLTVNEAAAAAKVSSKTIKRRIAEGRLLAVNYGTARRADWRIEPAALANLKPVENDNAELDNPARRRRRDRRTVMPPCVVKVW
jgi:excisionase family DNA binding protein